MTYFLVTYDRKSRSAALEEFQDARVAQGEYARLELKLMDDKQYEIVLLSAESESEIRQTHSRYFSDGLIPA